MLGTRTCSNGHSGQETCSDAVADWRSMACHMNSQREHAGLDRGSQGIGGLAGRSSRAGAAQSHPKGDGMERKCSHCGARVSFGGELCPRCRRPLDVNRTGRPARESHRGTARRFFDVFGSLRRAVLAIVLVVVILFAAGSALRSGPWRWPQVDASAFSLAGAFFLYVTAIPLVLYGMVHESMDFLAQVDPKSWTLVMGAFVGMGSLLFLAGLLYCLAALSGV